MHDSVHNLVPIPTLLHNALDRAVDAQEVLHLPDVLCLPRNRIVLPGKPQRLPETGVLLLRHQETQTQIGQPDGEAFHSTEKHTLTLREGGRFAEATAGVNHRFSVTGGAATFPASAAAPMSLYLGRAF